MNKIISIVVARAQNGTIGYQGSIPWHLPSDLRRFAALTLGHPVIMGRVTYESIPDRFRPLRGRHNIILTRNQELIAPENVTLVSSLPEAISIIRPSEEAFVIGGETVYREALPSACKIFLTEVEVSPPGDKFFPSLPSADLWKEESRGEWSQADGDQYRHRLIIYTKRSAF